MLRALPTRDTLAQAASLVGFRSTDRYKKRCQFLFRGVQIQGASILDVGCGTGAFAIWAGLHGARDVLGIEPETDGSTAGTLAQFRESLANLDLVGCVRAQQKYLSELGPTDGPFDVAILYQVINHLDETATLDLHKNPESVARFVTTLSHLRSLLNDGAHLIVADCARRNFWNDLGLVNPLMPTIEWEKHQPPRVWATVLEKCGFRLVRTSWSPMYPLGTITQSRIIHYFTISHFCMYLKAV